VLLANKSTLLKNIFEEQNFKLNLDIEDDKEERIQNLIESTIDNIGNEFDKINAKIDNQFNTLDEDIALVKKRQE